jgi:hypothetical protein
LIVLTLVMLTADRDDVAMGATPLFVSPPFTKRVDVKSVEGI